MPEPYPNGSPEPVEMSPERQAQEIRRLVGTLANRSWIILLCAALALLAAALYLRKAPRIYRAAATIQVEQQEQRILKVEQVLQEDLRAQEVLNTMVHKLRSRPLLARVVESNRLDRDPEFFADPQLMTTNTAAVIGALENMIKPVLRRSTRLIDITVDHRSPRLAAQIANSIVDQYMNEDTEMRTGSSRGANALLQEEVKRLTVKLGESEVALQKYREQVGSVSFQQNQESMLPRIQQYSLRLTQARADRLRAKALYDQILGLTNKVDELIALPLFATEPAVAEARLAAAKAESEFANVQLSFKHKHPTYIQAARQLGETRTNLVRAALGLVETYRMGFELAQMTEDSLAKAMREAEADAMKLSAQAIQFNLLSREMESDRVMLDSVLNRMKETSVTTGLQAEKIRLVQPAIVPKNPSSPRVTLIVLVAAVLGLGLGCAIVLGLNMFNTSIQSIDEAESFLRLPVLGVVARLPKLDRLHTKLLNLEEPDAPAAEAFRSLRTALAMLGRTEDRRCFLFTSALPSEGKSFCSVNYAAALAQQGLSTLLIDADLRRPAIEEYLTGRDGHHLGLTDVLTGQKTFGEVVQPVENVPKLSWMAAGTRCPNPSELLGANGIGTLLAEAQQRFDRVVVDSAPVHAVSDTLLIAPHMQTTVLVIRSQRTPRQPIARAIQLLESAGSKVSGLVLNAFQMRRHGYYYQDSYYYHGYYTKYGYGKDKDGRRTRRRKRRNATELAAKEGLTAEPLQASLDEPKAAAVEANNPSGEKRRN